LKIQNNADEPVNVSVYDAYQTTSLSAVNSTDYELYSEINSDPVIFNNTGSIDSSSLPTVSTSANATRELMNSANDWVINLDTADNYAHIVNKSSRFDYNVLEVYGTNSISTMVEKNMTNPETNVFYLSFRVFYEANYVFYIYLYNGATLFARMRTASGSMAWYTTSYANIFTMTANIVYHILLKIDLSTDKTTVYKNGTLVGQYNNAIATAPMNTTKLVFTNHPYATPTIFYVDSPVLSVSETVALATLPQSPLPHYANVSINFDLDILDIETVQSLAITVSFYSSNIQSTQFSLYNHFNAEFDIKENRTHTVDTAFTITETTFEANFISETEKYVNLSIYAYNASAFTLYLTSVEVNVTYVDTMITTTYVNISSTAEFSTLVYPYSSVLTNCSYAQINFSYVYVYDLYGNLLDNFTNTGNSIIFSPPNVREVFISLANQRGDYLDWENFQIKINGTQIYENRFYREIDTSWNISIYTRFNKYITSTVHTVDRDSNYIPITITQHSLKIYNQQELFAHSNISFNPAYYNSTQSWSEWIAPGEIVSYLLSPGSYLVNITESETHTSTVYTYILASDDILLVQSYNTLYNVLYNIENVNQTLGTQITDVYINITNQNSDINESIVNVVIEFTNINSTLGTMLYWQNTTMNAMANNITTFYIYSQSQFSILNNNINTSFALLNSSIYLMNNSIYTSINMLEAGLTLMNNTIMGNLTMFIQLSPELTAIYTNTLFSENLTWSTDSEAVLAQCDDYRFMNEYATQAVELELKYGSEVRTLYIAAQAQINQNIINHDVQYRVKSVQTGEYLTEYEDLDTKNVSVGYYDEVIPATPEEIRLEIKDYLMVALFFCIIALATAGMYILAKSDMNKNPKSQKNPDDAPGVSYTGGFYYGKRDRPPRKASSNSAVVTVIILAVMSFIVVYLAIMYGF
jgi:hypothetical protein